MDRQELGTSINLAEVEQQRILGAHVDGTQCLALDNLSTLMNGGPENDAESWDAMQAWLLQLRRRGMVLCPDWRSGVCLLEVAINDAECT